MSRNVATGLATQTAEDPSILLVAFAIMGLFIVTTEGRVPSAWADELSLSQLGKLPEGEITSVGATTLDVAGRFYGLHPKLTIVSDEGKPMELKQLRPGLIVQYNVKEGLLDRIVVLIPR